MNTKITNTKLKFKKWPELRSKYIYEWASLLDLSREYSGQISYNAIADRCKAEEWVRQREEHWAQVGQDYGAFITSKKIEAQKMMIESANLLIKSSKEAIEKYIADLEGKGEGMGFKEARDLMLTGFKILTYFMDKVDNDPHYSYQDAFQADRDIALMWQKAYFELLHSKGTIKENYKFEPNNDTSNTIRSQAVA